MLALTSGDPSGIGPEIAIAAWQARRERQVPPFFLLCDPALVERRARSLRAGLVTAIVTPDSTAGTFERALPVVPLEAAFVDEAGKPSAANAAGIVESIRRAVAAVDDGSAAAIVTNPIAKKLLYDAGFRHPGHTEFLGELAGERTGRPVRPVMMLAGPELRAVPVTIHIPLSQVPAALSRELIVETARITAQDLTRRFRIASPRLAVSGLNPHAGEDGAMGSEEQEVIAPAIHALRAEGIEAAGPLPADTMFHAAARQRYDAAICMYHDQALIPAKALAFDETVNVTLGLPFIRTSPDHGTAFDIAGKGVARCDSLVAALKIARAMADAEAARR